jgi:GAF domain-containing protein
MMTNKLDYFETFCRLSQAFGTAATREELLELIVQSATEAMNGKAACLFLADPKQDVFVPKAQWGLSENYLHASPLKAKKIVTALKKKGHLLFEDATSDPRLEHHDKKKAEGIASILTVAVMVDNCCIGVLSLYTSEKRQFSRQEIIFLKALAGNGGMAVKRARLLERMQKNAQLFLELTTAINSSLDIRQVLNNMTEKSCRALGMKGATIRLINEDSDTMDLVASYGLSERFLNKGAVLARKSISEALKGKTIVIDDVATDKRLQYTKETQAEGVASMVCLPIRSQENVIGVMRLYSEQQRQYSEDFLMLVEALAHVGALAIQNASMYLTLKEDKKNLEKEIWSHRSYF